MECKTKKEDDGYYHPETEDEIICLVKKAYDEGLQVRCRGAAHSVAWSIYTDPGNDDKRIPNKVSQHDPPEGTNINIMLDKFIGLVWEDEENGIVVADAGIHLGVDPNDPNSTLQNGLLYQANEKGWALGDLGGITHQTVSGFLMTGSAGGTLTHSLEENLLAFKVIDGTGEAKWIDTKDEAFNAVAISVGLLGIITKVRLQLTKNYYIIGQELTAPDNTEGCPIDMFGLGREGKPSLAEFMKKTPYCRILWWPQKKAERIVIWQAVRAKTIPSFEPIPYKEFSDGPFVTQLQQMAAAIIFTIPGNKGFFKIWNKLRRSFKQFKKNLRGLWKQKMGLFFAWILASLVMFLLKVFTFLPVLFFSICKACYRGLFPFLINTFQPLTKKGKSKIFMDYMWRSLPMDNAADDLLLGMGFSELWIPISRTEEVMKLLKNYLDEKGFDGTGYSFFEIYAYPKSTFWISPSYHEDQLRIDLIWYINNEDDPAIKDGYYAQFWELLREKQIPFRLHWGKYLPEYDYNGWVDYFKSQYPRWDDFMELRAKRDPKNIFLTDYWKRHLYGVE